METGAWWLGAYLLIGTWLIRGLWKGWKENRAGSVLSQTGSPLGEVLCAHAPVATPAIRSQHRLPSNDICDPSPAFLPNFRSPPTTEPVCAAHIASRAPVPDLFLLEDNPLVLEAWQLAARGRNHHLVACSTVEQARQIWQNLPRHVPLYIDENLGPDVVSGTVLCQEALDMGFTRVYLATGYAPEQFGVIPGLAGVVGKIYPENI